MDEMKLLQQMRAEMPTPDPNALAVAVGWRSEHPAEPRRSNRWRSPVLTPNLSRGLIVGAVLTAVLGAVLAIGPSVVPGRSSSATSYANSAIEIEKQNGYWVAKIKDPLADHERYAEGFRAVGLDVRLSLVPASPADVGRLVWLEADKTETSPPQRGDGTPTPRFHMDISAGNEPSGCQIRQGDCRLAVRISEDFHGAVSGELGRPAQQGEPYRYPTLATDPGEVLQSVDAHARPVAEVLDEVRKRDLQVVYERVTSHDEGPSNHVTQQRYNLTFAPIDASEVGPKWVVWQARSIQDGVIQLQVSPEKLKPLP
ncbi:hypothetical protein B0I32_15112 [Nonomuraea fuscirosea]|uniref:Uncharacterized protein n=1 Tax=Nonomuraea fuscirosea TaxID=1291556 RepID=A0A2T0LMR9_9ACTN|nr:hypothetical protein [Nonomuraea fuscirosea]PRX44425.1 hypothetical protein B0I32_15112 [Nonomuraea fuscirosea]